MRLQDKIAIVTGAASGFGAGIARRFASEGASVVANDLREDRAQRIVDEIRRAGGRAVACAGDVAQDADVATAAVFFASDEAAFITGACMEVDGGRCI